MLDYSPPFTQNKFPSLPLMSDSTHLPLLLQTAFDAGKVILEIYTTAFQVEYKADESPLTLADRKADGVIADALAITGIPILSEEVESGHAYSATRAAWSRCWIVDPLDGTKEFVKRNGEFTVNIALVEQGQPILAVVYAPAKGLLYYAEKGRGAYRIAIADPSAETPVFASPALLPVQNRPAIFTIAGSRNHSSTETEQYVHDQEKRYGQIDFKAAGSSLKFCMVAEGLAHVYPRFTPTMEWDTAAGQLIAEESGCTVSIWPSGEPLRYNRELLTNPFFLVKAPEIA